jgi:hypothetical protein
LSAGFCTVRDLYDSAFTLEMLATAIEQAVLHDYIEGKAAEIARQQRT